MNILFLCVANSARSQMAEGLARALLGPEVRVASAGSEPCGNVSSNAIAVMREVGIELSSHRSKGWDELPSEFFQNLTFVITLCAEEICPQLAVNAKKLHWGMPDPARAGNTDAERLEAFRKTRDEIERRLKEFKKQF